MAVQRKSVQERRDEIEQQQIAPILPSFRNPPVYTENAGAAEVLHDFYVGGTMLDWLARLGGDGIESARPSAQDVSARIAIGQAAEPEWSGRDSAIERAVKIQQGQEAERAREIEQVGGGRARKSRLTNEAPYPDAGIDSRRFDSSSDSSPSGSSSSSYTSSALSAYDGVLAELGALEEMLGDRYNLTTETIDARFGAAEAAANLGIGAIADTYAQGQSNVNKIYDNMAAELAGLPAEAVGFAQDAANLTPALQGHVASAAAESAAPFAAAGAADRANALENLERGSTSGQAFLQNLAAHVPHAEALAQSAASIAYQEAVVSLAQQKASIEINKIQAQQELAADSAASSYEEFIGAALSLTPGGAQLAALGASPEQLAALGTSDLPAGTVNDIFYPPEGEIPERPEQAIQRESVKREHFDGSLGGLDQIFDDVVRKVALAVGASASDFDSASTDQKMQMAMAIIAEDLTLPQQYENQLVRALDDYFKATT